MSDDISKMNYKELRNEVQLLRDELAMMKRTFEDIIHNLDTDNFSSRFVKEQGDMRTAIEVNAEGIKSTVSKKDLEQYSTIKQTAEQIQNVVSKSAKLDEAIPITTIEKATDTSKIYALQEKNDDGDVISETYYYFNDITEQWEVLSGDNIYTVFNQTAEGFSLKGNVKVDGSCVLTGTLTFNSSDRPLDVQYSTDGENDWHYDFDSSEDKFMRIKIGAQWSEAMKVVGTDGKDGGTASVTFKAVNTALGNLFKTWNGGTPTSITSAYIYSPAVKGGEFYGSVFYAGSGEGYSQMDDGGFSIYDDDGNAKLGIGYVTNGYNYPYMLLGVGAGYESSGAGLVYKLGSGVWIGDSSVLPYGGEYPGNCDSITNISTDLPNATGLFIDFAKDKIYKYLKGVPTEL